jgi:cytochrome c-type biogenesis protein CcmH
MKRLFIVIAALLTMAAASDPAERLPDPAQEARARHIFQEVRCLVCQNESIDDSEADLARDLRAIVRQQVAAGRTDAEVRAFLVDRYGEFVLLKPPFSIGNLALWLGPLAALLLGASMMAALLRRRTPPQPLDDDEEARLADLMKPAVTDTIKPQ